MKALYSVNNSNLNTKYVSEQDVLSEKFDISTLELDDCIINDNRIILNDYNNPISYVNNSLMPKTLCFNPEYYEKNKDEINSLIINFIENYSGTLFIRSSKLINDKVIDAIASNHNIAEVYLGSRDDVYLLKDIDYKKLKNGTICNIVTYGVEKELEFNFDEIIEYNAIRDFIGCYNYDDLKDMDDNCELSLYKCLTDREIENFKLLKGGTIYFTYNDYKNILDSIEKIESINPNFKYKIKVKDDDKKHFNKELFGREYISNKINVVYDFMYLSVNDYLKYEKQLYEMIKPALNISEYEKFLYAYDITKHYKEYKEVAEDDDKYKSRILYKVLDNDEYIVCVGYANLLNDLLTKLEIQSSVYNVGVDVGFDKVDVLQENVDSGESEYGGHARVIVNLVDSKYGINGIYQSDPTWDNVLGEDSYIYSLMTFDEASKNKRYLYQDKTVYNFLSSKTLKEFYDKVNNYMDDLINNDIWAIKIDEKRARMRVVNDTLDVIKKLDSNYYNSLIDKYTDIEKKDYNVINNCFKDYLYDVGNYIVSKSNNRIKLEQIKPCIEFLYSKFYGLSEADVKKEVDRTIDFNKKRMDKLFPITYRINQDGTKEVYSYLENKFETDTKSIK